MTPKKPISSADIVESNFKSFGPYFHGLGDAPRAVLEYPGAGASEEFLLLVPKDADEYDPLMELLATVRAIVGHTTSHRNSARHSAHSTVSKSPTMQA